MLKRGRIMFKNLFVITLLLFSYAFASPTQLEEKAPSFKAETSQDKLMNFPKDFEGKWVIFFSFPNVFSPVCTSEIESMMNRAEDFRRANCVLLGVSLNDNVRHRAWLKSIENKTKRKIPSNLVIITDKYHFISKKYNFIHPKENKYKMVRSVYFIDPKGKIRAVIMYPMHNGRNIGELYRILIAMQTTDRIKNGVTPCDWKPNDPVQTCAPCSSKEKFCD
jgi:peroxiredoxin (alkyl hydroperoxide reductase subunit C)